MRQLTAYASYLDNLGAPLVGRARFYNLDDSPAVVYGMDNAHQHYVQLGHIVYTNSSGQLVPQVFLADHDYLVVFDKYIGGGTMAEDDDPESWQEMGSAVDKYNTVGIELDGSAVRSFGTVDALRSAIPVESADGDDEIVELLGYYEPGDKPSIQYQWDPNSSEPDNGGSVLGAGAVGRWKLVECPEFLDVRHFGAFPDQTSGGNADQRNRVQLAGAYAHFNSCGIHFYGDALAVYYDISGLELFKTTSDDIAKVYAVSGTESTIREVVNINCGADQFTTLSNQGKITLYGGLLRSSFAPNYNVQFEPTSKIVIDANVNTSNLEIWNALVEVTVDKTTSHWVFNNCQFESDHRIGNNVTFNGPTELKQRYFSFTDMDYDTITVNDNVLLDIDDWRYVNDWCKLVKQQSVREFDIKGKTLNSNCNLNFSSDDVVTLMNARLNNFSCTRNLDLKNCEGTLEYPLDKTLRLYNCSEGIVISSINENADVVSRFSNIQFTSGIKVSSLNAVGSIIYSSSNTLTVKNAVVATSTRILAALDAGDLGLIDCVLAKDAAGKIVTLRGCTIDGSHVTAYAPYDGSNANLITVMAVGCKFLGSSKLKLTHIHSSGDTSKPYDIEFNVCGNFSDHDFIDDSAFNGVTHTVVITKCVYKGNYGGCPVESSSSSESINYEHSTLTSGGENGEIPSGQANNTLRLYSDSRDGFVSDWDQATTWWCLKVNKTLALDSLNLFRFKYLHVGNSVRVSPKCICYSNGVESLLGRCSNEIPMMPFSVNFVESYQYSAVYTVDYGLIGSAQSLDNDGQNQHWYGVKIGQRFRYILEYRYPSGSWQGSCQMVFNVDETGFVAY